VDGARNSRLADENATENYAATGMLNLKSIQKDSPLETYQFDGSKRTVYESAISALT